MYVLSSKNKGFSQKKATFQLYIATTRYVSSIHTGEEAISKV